MAPRARRSGAAARPLRIGFLDGLFRGSEAPMWLGIAHDDGADLARLPSACNADDVSIPDLH